LRTYPPKTSDTCILGQKAKNTTHEWYIKGGTFCSRCRIKFTFEETNKLLLRDTELGRKHGVPRCWNCGQSLRTRSKSCDCDGFWERLKEKPKLKCPKCGTEMVVGGQLGWSAEVLFCPKCEPNRKSEKQK